MRTETTTRTLYQFGELSDKAKQRAIEKLYDINTDYDWWDCTYDTIKTAGACLGIDVQEIYFSGFWSQGDGACFTGEYQYRKNWRAALRTEFGGDSLPELERIGTWLQSAQRDAFYSLTAGITHTGRYYHEMSARIDVSDTRHRYGYTTEARESDISEALRDFMRWSYRLLEREYDFLTSEEAIIEAIEANEYEFDENGNLA